jgi:hypothetical protein
MWNLLGANATGPTSNGQPDVEDLEAGSMREKLSATPESGILFGLPLLHLWYTWNQDTPPPPPPLVTGGDRFTEFSRIIRS